MKQICEKHRPKQRAPLIEFIIMRAEVILLVILAVPIFCVYTPSLEPHHLRLVSRHAKKSEKSSKTDNVFRANRSSLGLLLHYRRPSTCPYVAHQNRRSPNNHHNLLLHWKSTPRALTFLGLRYWLNWAVWCALPFTLLSAAQCLPNATTIHHNRHPKTFTERSWHSMDNKRIKILNDFNKYNWKEWIQNLEKCTHH